MGLLNNEIILESEIFICYDASQLYMLIIFSGFCTKLQQSELPCQMCYKYTVKYSLLAVTLA